MPHAYVHASRVCSCTCHSSFRRDTLPLTAVRSINDGAPRVCTYLRACSREVGTGILPLDAVSATHAPTAPWPSRAVTDDARSPCTSLSPHAVRAVHARRGAPVSLARAVPQTARLRRGIMHVSHAAHPRRHIPRNAFFASTCGLRAMHVTLCVQRRSLGRNGGPLWGLLAPGSLGDPASLLHSRVEWTRVLSSLQTLPPLQIPPLHSCRPCTVPVRRTAKERFCLLRVATGGRM